MGDLIGNSERNILHGTEWTDNSWGGGGNDVIYTYASHEALYGEAGNDYLNGGGDVDYLIGGRGADRLVGGSGDDQFFFHEVGDSPSRNGQADTILDWNVRDDFINCPIGGNTTIFGEVQYAEAATQRTTMNGARLQAEKGPYDRDVLYVFLYNKVADKGFLLADIDDNGSYETGVIIKGAGSARDMSSDNII